LQRDEVLADAVLKGFDVLGGDQKKVLLFHLENATGLSLDSEGNHSIRVSDLQQGLASIFGPKGAQFLLERVFLEMERMAEAKRSSAERSEA